MLETKEYEPCLVDIWQAGVVLFTMLTGKLPFKGSGNMADTLTRMRARLDLTLYAAYRSPDAQALLKGVLCYSPRDRFSMKRVRQSDWLLASHDQVAIGNFYLASNPRKTASSAAEEMLKRELGI